MKTDVGTFQRKTARTYTHLVAVNSYTDTYKAKETDLANSHKWGDWWKERIADMENNWHVLGWCGRLDLAQQLARGHQAGYFQHVRIYDVSTGALVQGVR